METPNGLKTEPRTASYGRRDFVDMELGVRRVKDVVEVEPESSVVEQESSISY